MPIPREQLRLTPQELDELCASERDCHIATVSSDGRPHVVPLWFAWHDGEIWVNSLRKSKRARDLSAGSPVSVCIDTGIEYAELRGAVFYGRFADASEHSSFEAVRSAYASKYFGVPDVPIMKSHVWLRLEAERVVSWDFRKIPDGRDRRIEAAGRSEP